MLFGKKKDPNSMTVMHYEGLNGFKQDFPCEISLEDDGVLFKNNEGRTAKLSYSQIQAVDAMTEKNFQAKYHNFQGTTKYGTVWFRVIRYISSSGEEKYIALWDVSTKSIKFFEQLESRIQKKPSETIL